MAAPTVLSAASVCRIWQAHGRKPHAVESCKLSSDPRFAGKPEDIGGLDLNLPAQALVLSLDEKSQIRALDRTHPGLPLKRGHGQTMTRGDKRHATTTRCAALDIAGGQGHRRV
jgi:hypothetical protein